MQNKVSRTQNCTLISQIGFISIDGKGKHCKKIKQIEITKFDSQINVPICFVSVSYVLKTYPEICKKKI